MNVIVAMRLSMSAYSNTDDAALASIQEVLGEEIWDKSQAEQQARRAAYKLTVSKLERRHPDWTVWQTDPWTAETYSELWKDEYGVRPRGEMSPQAARDWLDNKLVEQFFDKLQDHAEDMADMGE